MTLVAFILSPGAAGCISTSPAQPFADVQDNVHQRTGHQIEWNRFAEGAAEIEATVNDLLARELTAETAVQVALLNNRRLQAIYAQLGLAQADLVRAGLLRNPIFHGVVRWAPGSQRIFDFSLVQDFLDLLLMPLELDLARTELESAKLEVAREVIDLAAETRRAFFDHVANEQMLELWQSILLASESSYQMARQLRLAGNITELNVLSEQAVYERAKLEVARTEAGRVRFRERLNRLMGLWGEPTQWRAVAKLPDVPEPAEHNRIEAAALAANLDLQRAYVEIEAAARRFKVLEVMEIIPTFDLGGAVEFEKEESVELVERRRRKGSKYELKEIPGPTEIWSGPEISIAIPVFDQGQAARAAGRSEIARRFERYTALATEIRSAARELAYRAANARQRVVFHRDVFVPLRETITRETQLRYNAMFDGVFQLLRAKEQEIETRLGLIEALHEFWHAESQLDQLRMGSLPEEFRSIRAPSGPGRRAQVMFASGARGRGRAAGDHDGFASAEE